MSGLSSGSSLGQTTGDPAVLTATQPVEAPSTRGPVTASKSATSRVEGPGMSDTAKCHLVESPSAGMAIQPVRFPVQVQKLC